MYVVYISVVCAIFKSLREIISVSTHFDVQCISMGLGHNFCLQFSFTIIYAQFWQKNTPSLACLSLPFPRTILVKKNVPPPLI